MKKLAISRILVPVDFSNNSMNALQTAVEMAKLHKAKIRIIHIIDEDYSYSELDAVKNRSTSETYIKALTRLAGSVKNSEGIPCDYSIYEGSVTGHILRESAEYQPDLIIMGKNGNTGSRKNYAGSLACQIVKKSAVPVLLTPTGKIHDRFRNMLFPARPILSVVEKMDAISDFVRANGAHLHVQNLRNPDHPEEVHIISHLTDILKMKAEKKDIPLSVEYFFENGRFSEYILQKTGEKDSPYDLLIITAETDRHINDFYLGTYAQSIIHQSAIPVLVFRPQAATLSKEKVLAALETEFELIN